MARTMSLIRVAAMRTRQPARLIEHLNEQLCAGNDANVFVTIFCAFLHVSTGRLSFANAGHCAPLLAHAGHASRLPLPKGALVGVKRGLRYTADEVELPPGVVLVCFTDGIPEAESAAGGDFSQERLTAVVAAHASGPVDALLERVQRRALVLSEWRAACGRLHAYGSSTTGAVTCRLGHERRAWIRRTPPMRRPAGIRSGLAYARLVLYTSAGAIPPVR